MTEMPDSIDVECPACGHLTEVAPEWVGRQARCQCGFTFVVSAAVPTRVLADPFDPLGQNVAGRVIGDVVEGDPAARSASATGAVSSSTFRPASAAQRQSEIPGDLGDLLRPDEIVRHAETTSAATVFLRVASLMLLVGLPLMLVTLGALSGNSPGGVCAGITGLGVLGVVLLVNTKGWRARSVVITDRRTLVRSGALVTRVQLIPHRAVVFLSVETGLVDRMARTQSIRIHTAGQSVLLRNSSDVDRVVALLAEVRDGHDDSL